MSSASAKAPPRLAAVADRGGEDGGSGSRDGTPLLWHLKVSHYNEKARWALDYKGVAHARRAVGPPRHRQIAKRLTGGLTFPILVLDGEAIGDSTRIIAELERRRPKPPLYPADPGERRRALEIEEFFDEEFGPYARQLVLYHLLPDPRLLLGTFDSDLRGVRLFRARAMYPLIRRRVVSGFGIDEAGIALAVKKCRAAGERFKAELQPSGYLVGDGFTVADLTVAALVSPLIAPEQFPYPQPQRGHPRLAPLRDLLDEYGAGEWARGIYARHRGVSAEISPPGRPSSV
jgi:glutathione S-transferase